MINADKFTPVNKGLIPTGELKPVTGTHFDFKTPTAMGVRIDQDDEQLKFGKGYDHNWVLNSGAGLSAKVAEVCDPATGRVMEVHTTEPALQFYTGNFLDGTILGKGGKVCNHHAALSWKRSTTRTPPTSRPSPRPNSTPAKPANEQRSTSSPPVEPAKKRGQPDLR